MSISSGEVKEKPTLHKRAYGGVHLPLLGLEPVAGEPLMSVMRGQCDARPTALPPQPQGITAHWLVPNYTAWWQRHMRVNNLPRVALDSGAAGIRTRDLLIASPARYRYATEPPLSADSHKCLVPGVPPIGSGGRAEWITTPLIQCGHLTKSGCCIPYMFPYRWVILCRIWAF